MPLPGARDRQGLPAGAMVLGDPIRVPEVDGEALEVYRKQVEDGVNAVTNRGYELVDRRDLRP